MLSPFPGMNPYLEQENVWQDFHDCMVAAISDALSPQVRPGYIVNIEEHSFIHEPNANELVLLGHGDVSLAHRKSRIKAGGGSPRLRRPRRGFAYLRCSSKSTYSWKSGARSGNWSPWWNCGSGPAVR